MNATRLGKGMTAVSVVLALLLGTWAVDAAEPATTPKQTVMKETLGGLWAKLRAATPRSAQASTAPTLTAGLRGAEATETELKPYWKGDREQDPAYRAENQALQRAQNLADAGKFAEAARAFDAFLASHPRSPLAPNALFGAALARAALGDKARASTGFEAFIRQNSQHALARDAEQALAALR
jgi:TolA-binding protein